MSYVQISNKRVVITGLGAVSPLGITADATFNNIIASKSGIGKITHFDATSFKTKVAGEVKFTTQQGDGLFDPLTILEFKESKKVDKFMMYAIHAAEEALTQAGWKPTNDYDLSKTAVVVGSGIGGLGVIQDQVLKGMDKISPFFIPKALINLASGQISIKYGFTGPNHAVVTACATGAHAIYDAALLIKQGISNVVVCGGAESAVCEIGIGGFNALGALSTKYNDTPTKASRPWDKNRDGFVMGEGAGIVILEDYEHAKKRGVKILGELISVGMSGDAYHITSPAPDGRGAKMAMQMAIEMSGVDPSKINYINAHGTSTPIGDEIELNAVKAVLGPHFIGGRKINMSSTKSSVGHLLGAAGSLEAVICIKSIMTKILPPTLNLEDPCDGHESFDLIPNVAKQVDDVNYVLSNSFGFGGTNISLIFKRFID